MCSECSAIDRRRSGRRLLGVVLPIFVTGLLAGCGDTPPRQAALSPRATPASVSPSPAAPSSGVTAGKEVAVPPPPPLPEPHPTRDEMRVMRQQLDATPAPAPEEAAHLADAIGDMERLETILRAQVKAAPQNVALRYRLADVLLRRVKLGEARELYQALSKEDPHSPLPYLGLSDIAHLEGKQTEAWAFLAQGVTANRIGPESVGPLVLLAQRYLLWNDKKTAETVLRQALVLQPAAPAPLLALTSLYRDMGRTEESKKILSDMVERDPQNLEARRQLAALIAAGATTPADRERAGRLLVDIFQSGKVRADDFMTAAKLYEDDQDWAGAAQSFVQALALDPERLEARYHLQQAYRRLGAARYADEENALYTRQREEQGKRGHFTSVRIQSPRLAAAHFAEAQFAEKTKDYRVAVIAYGMAAQLAPHDLKIRTARTRFYQFLGWPAP